MTFVTCLTNPIGICRVPRSPRPPPHHDGVFLRVNLIPAVKPEGFSNYLICNKTSSNKSSFLRYLPLFWPVWQSKAALELKYTRWYTYCYPWICVDWVMVFKFLEYSLPTPLHHSSLVLTLPHFSNLLSCVWHSFDIRPADGAIIFCTFWKRQSIKFHPQ